MQDDISTLKTFECEYIRRDGYELMFPDRDADRSASVVQLNRNMLTFR